MLLMCIARDLSCIQYLRVSFSSRSLCDLADSLRRFKRVLGTLLMVRLSRLIFLSLLLFCSALMILEGCLLAFAHGGCLLLLRGGISLSPTYPTKRVFCTPEDSGRL